MAESRRVDGRKVVPTYPFAVDHHVNAFIYAQLLNFWNVLDVLHVRCVATSAEDAGDACSRVDIVRCDESASGVVDKRHELDGEFLYRW